MYLLRRETIINQPIQVVWEYFSDPKNLQNITPKEMGFEVLTKDLRKAYQGQIICYKIKVLPMIRLNWVTEIAHLKEQKYFVDEQRFGPYRFWYHEHLFEEFDGKTRMIDIVHYKLPVLPLAVLVNKFFVRPKLEGIFNYRSQKIFEIFK